MNTTTTTTYGALNVCDTLIVEGMRVRVDAIETRTGASTTGRDLVVGTGTILNPEYVTAHPAIFGGIVNPERPWAIQGIPSRVAVIVTN